MDSDRYDDTCLAELWAWFVAHAAELRPGRLTAELVAQLEARLFAVAKVDWEIGPAPDGDGQVFALSPSGDRDKLALTRWMVASAPAVAGWSFLPAKPRRAWTLAFEAGGVAIDAQGWEVVVYRIAGDVHDLVFKIDVSHGAELDAHAARIVVDGELGEALRMALVRDIEIVERWDERGARAARRLEPGLLARVVKPAV